MRMFEYGKQHINMSIIGKNQVQERHKVTSKKVFDFIHNNLDLKEYNLSAIPNN